MIENIVITRGESSQKRKELKKDGWLSAHYWTRHGWNVDILRSRAKKEKLRARILCTDGVTTWYYHESDIAKLASDFNVQVTL